MEMDSGTSLQNIEASIAKYQGLVAAEDDKMLRYKVWDNLSFHYNYCQRFTSLEKAYSRVANV